MQIGVDYYPEQWDHALWSNDAKLMAETGVKLVRIAESAWYKMQPDENEFNLEWLDELISLFSNYGISVLLCTLRAFRIYGCMKSILKSAMLIQTAIK